MLALVPMAITFAGPGPTGIRIVFSKIMTSSGDNALSAAKNALSKKSYSYLGEAKAAAVSQAQNVDDLIKAIGNDHLLAVLSADLVLDKKLVKTFDDLNELQFIRPNREANLSSEYLAEAKKLGFSKYSIQLLVNFQHDFHPTDLQWKRLTEVTSSYARLYNRYHQLGNDKMKGEVEGRFIQYMMKRTEFVQSLVAKRRSENPTLIYKPYIDTSYPWLVNQFSSLEMKPNYLLDTSGTHLGIDRDGIWKKIKLTVGQKQSQRIDNMLDLARMLTNSVNVEGYSYSEMLFGLRDINDTYKNLEKLYRNLNYDFEFHIFGTYPKGKNQGSFDPRIVMIEGMRVGHSEKTLFTCVGRGTGGLIEYEIANAKLISSKLDPLNLDRSINYKAMELGRHAEKLSQVWGKILKGEELTSDQMKLVWAMNYQEDRFNIVIDKSLSLSSLTSMARAMRSELEDVLSIGGYTVGDLESLKNDHYIHAAFHGSDNINLQPFYEISELGNNVRYHAGALKNYYLFSRTLHGDINVNIPFKNSNGDIIANDFIFFLPKEHNGQTHMRFEGNIKAKIDSRENRSAVLLISGPDPKIEEQSLGVPMIEILLPQHAIDYQVHLRNLFVSNDTVRFNESFEGHIILEDVYSVSKLDLPENFSGRISYRVTSNFSDNNYSDHRYNCNQISQSLQGRGYKLTQSSEAGQQEWIWRVDHP